MEAVREETGMSFPREGVEVSYDGGFVVTWRGRELARRQWLSAYVKPDEGWEIGNELYHSAVGDLEQRLVEWDGAEVTERVCEELIVEWSPDTAADVTERVEWSLDEYGEAHLRTDDPDAAIEALDRDVSIPFEVVQGEDGRLLFWQTETERSSE